MQSMLYISYSSFKYDVFVDQTMYSRPRQVYWPHKLKDITVNKKEIVKKLTVQITMWQKGSDFN